MMRVTVEAADLAAAMKHSVAQRTGTLPVLQHALLQAEGGALRIITSDLETTMECAVPASVQSPGGVCALAAGLAAAAAIGAQIELVEHPTRLDARGGGRNGVRLAMLPEAEFPLPDSEPWQPMACDPLALRRALESVAYAAAVRDVRYYLNGVHLDQGYAAASNGKRVARCLFAYESAPLTIPIHVVPSVIRMLDESSVVELAVGSHGGGRVLRVTLGGVTLTTLLMKEATNFPAVEKVIPTDDDLDFSMQLSRAELQRAVHGLLPFADGRAESRKSGSTTTHIRWQDDELRLQVPNLGEGIGVDIADGGEAWGALDAGVELADLARILDAIPTDTVQLSHATRPQRAFLIEGSGDATAHVLAESHV